MPTYMLFNELGVVDRSGNAAYPPPEAVTVDMPIDHATLHGFYLAKRPELPPIARVGTAWTVSGCPVGARVEVIDDTGGEVMFLGEAATDGEDFTFDLPDAGKYEINVVPPLPWMPIIQKVTVE